MYYHSEIARVNAELVRPVLPADMTTQKDEGYELLLWSFLLRTIQTRLYIHRCTQKYCLFNRRSCRFFFP